MNPRPTLSILIPVLALAAAPVATQAGGASGAPARSLEVYVPADFPTIQQAIDAAPARSIVVVADGVWRGNGNRNLDFGGKDLVVRSAGGAAHCTIDCQGTPLDPQRAFVFSSGESRAARVQGFTIVNGATEDGAVADQFNGGAIQITQSSPTIADCIFRDNYAGCWGAAIYSGNQSAPRIERCLFVDNLAADDGGGVFTWDWNTASSAIEIVRSAFIDNRAVATGGAISNFGGSTMVLENLTLVGNTAPNGSAIFTSDQTILRNSIVWQNPEQNEVLWGHSSQLLVENTIVEGGHPGNGNLDVDPMLATDRLHLLLGSPALDLSWDSLLQGSLDDFEGDRPFGAVDLGADELPLGEGSRGSTGPNPPGVLRR